MHQPLADELPIYRAAQREDLALFTGAHFQTLAPGTRYTPNWHAAAIAHQLQEVFEGRCRRLVINAPPRLLKSTLASVTFPAWGLGRDPTRRFVCVSHTQDLATEFANHCRILMKSPGYRALFPHAIVSSRKDTETQFSMIAGGGRTSLSLNGPITGRGGDIIVIDDPIKAQDVFSELKRAEAQTWLRSTAVTRLNNPATGAIVLVMQRLHEDDPAGYVLEQGGWRHLNLPAKAQEDMIVPVGVGLTHVFRKGDLLDPRRLPQEELDQRMREMGESGFRPSTCSVRSPPTAQFSDAPGSSFTRPTRRSGAAARSFRAGTSR